MTTPRVPAASDGQSRLPRWRIGALIAAFLGLAVWYSTVIPLGEAPDEVAHFTYIQNIARQGRLPTTHDEHEAFQPPLYYMLGAGLTFWIDDNPDAPLVVRANADYDIADARAPKNLLLHTAAEAWPYRGWALAWHAARLLSIALGATTVWAVYRLGKVLFPGRPAIPSTMAALTAFTPQFLFMSAVVNNDNAAVALSALLLWRIAALLHEPDHHRLVWHCVAIGLLAGLGMLSKASLIAAAATAALAIVLAGLRSRTADGSPLRPKERARLAARGLVAAGVVAAAVAGWYFVRNWRLHGDPLGWSFLLQVNALREGPLTAEVLQWLARGVFRSFWLGWIGIAFEDAVYWLIGGVCLAGLAGFCAWLIRRRHLIDRATLWTLGLMGLSAAITLASLVKWTATVLGTDQGRLIYPILPSVMLVIASGWAWWADQVRGGRVVPVGLAAAMLILALVTPVRYIAPVHAPAPVATQAEVAQAKRLDVDWGSVRLLGYRLESNQVEPGGKLVLDLYWEGLQPMERDWMALIQLVDQNDKFLMFTDGSPTAGRDTTDRWTPGVPLASRHLLPIPDYGQPGEYTLTITMHPFGEQTWLTAVGPDGSVIGDRLVLPEAIRVVRP